MVDTIACAQLNDPAQAIAALPWPPASFVYLERVPGGWLSAEEAAGAVCLAELDPALPFAAYERGRVFCSEFELRWEKVDGSFAAVLAGAVSHSAPFTPAVEPGLAAAQVCDTAYPLWGSPLPAEVLAALDPVIAGSGPANSRPFLELRIPRVLWYPVGPDANRVQIRVREYYDSDSGELLYYRFVSVEGSA